MPTPPTPPASAPADRLAGAVWGPFLADARETGALSRHGEAALALLASLAAAGPDATAYGETVTAAADPATVIAGLAPLVVLRLGHPALMLDVDAFTRVVADDDRAVAYACAHARLLEHLLAGGGLDAGARRVAAMLDRRTPLGAELGEVFDGAPAGADGAPPAAVFATALRAALAHRDDAVAAVESADAGAMLVASWLGARHGVAAFPAAWRERLDAGPAIAAALARLVARRPGAPAAVRQ